MAQDHVQFLEETPCRQGRERPFDDILIERDFVRNDERQGAEHGRIDGRYDLGRMQGVFFRPFLTAQAEEDHRRQFHAGSQGFFPGFDGEGRCRPLIDEFQDVIVAAFDAHVDDGQTGFAKTFQFFRGLADQVGRRRIGADAVQVGEFFVALLHDSDELVRWQDQGVAIGQKDTADKGHGISAALDDPFDFLHGTDAELRSFVHIAETASIVRTADSNAQNEAAGFTRRAEDKAASIINNHK